VKGLVPVDEAIGDERPQYAMLLVDAIEERTDVTARPQYTRGVLGRVRGGLHNLT
jgi:hypothetical protein